MLNNNIPNYKHKIFSHEHFSQIKGSNYSRYKKTLTVGESEKELRVTDEDIKEITAVEEMGYAKEKEVVPHIEGAGEELRVTDEDIKEITAAEKMSYTAVRSMEVKDEPNRIVESVVQKSIRKIKNKNKVIDTVNGHKDQSSYYFAKMLMKKYQICHLSENEPILWMFNGKFYTPLPADKLETLIYAEIPDNKKMEIESCKAIKVNVCNYIKDECRLLYTKPENGYRCFSLDDMKRTYGKVVLNNGVYDVVREKLLSWTPEEPFYYGINAEFLETHSYDKLQTPYFDKILKDATGNDIDSIKMVWYVFGLLLLPNKCKKFAVIGPASNSGKSVVFGQFLDRLMESDRIMRTSTSELGNRFSLGRADDKILISCLDVNVEPITPKAAGIIKRVTGEEMITVEEKYKQSHEMVIRFHFLFGTNGNFSPQKYDSGWVNRIIAVPFMYETPENKQIPNLLEKLLEEKDAIVTKALCMARDVLKADGSIVIPESQLSIELKNQWTLCYTFFNEFCQNCVIFTGNKTDHCSRKEIYELYESYYFSCIKKDKRYGRYEKMPERIFFNKLEQQAQGLLTTQRIREEGEKNARRKIAGLKLRSF